MQRKFLFDTPHQTSKCCLGEGHKLKNKNSSGSNNKNSNNSSNDNKKHLLSLVIKVLQKKIIVALCLFPCWLQGRDKALMFCGEGGGRERSCFFYIFEGNLASRIRRPNQQYNISTVIHHHVRCNHQNTAFALWEGLLKNPNGMYDFIYNSWFIYKDVVWWGWEKNPEIYKNETKEIPFGYPPVSPSTKWKLTVFRCPKTPKTSRISPKWERVPNLMGQKRLG